MLHIWCCARLEDQCVSFRPEFLPVWQVKRSFQLDTVASDERSRASKGWATATIVLIAFPREVRLDSCGNAVQKHRTKELTTKSWTVSVCMHWNNKDVCVNYWYLFRPTTILLQWTANSIRLCYRSMFYYHAAVAMVLRSSLRRQIESCPISWSGHKKYIKKYLNINSRLCFTELHKVKEAVRRVWLWKLENNYGLFDHLHCKLGEKLIFSPRFPKLYTSCVLHDRRPCWGSSHPVLGWEEVQLFSV